MKVYTKTGDTGQTSLYDGTRAPKFTIIFEVLGEMDELSSRIGMLCALIPTSNKKSYLRKIQGCLQKFNSHVATIDRKGKKLPELSENLVTELETYIDEMETENPKLTKFILPGVQPADAQCHLCRTQARRAERFIIELHTYGGDITVTKKKKQISIDLTDFTIPEVMLCYMNRLSDFFFVLARWLCVTNGIEDCFME